MALRQPAMAGWRRIVALLAVLYAIGGFVLLPWYAQRELSQIVAEKLQRKAQVDEIKFNPFTLTLEAKNFSLKEHDGRPLVSFKHALIDLEWRALLHHFYDPFPTVEHFTDSIV